MPYTHGTESLRISLNPAPRPPSQTKVAGSLKTLASALRSFMKEKSPLLRGFGVYSPPKVDRISESMGILLEYTQSFILST